MESLNFATNLFGNIDEKIKGRILIYLDEPNADNWDDIQGIIINGESFKTIWQAVIEVKPDFPKIGRKETFNGEIIEDWKEIPSKETIIKAIQKQVYNFNNN